uniref:Uncharacterized protein n=1 Tax=Arundo donax TaxID=35708 RepID=A0A0A9G5X5_ARUDO
MNHFSSLLLVLNLFLAQVRFLPVILGKLLHFFVLIPFYLKNGVMLLFPGLGFVMSGD